MQPSATTQTLVLEGVIQIVSAHAQNNTIATEQVPGFIAQVTNALLTTAAQAQAQLTGTTSLAPAALPSPSAEPASPAARTEAAPAPGKPAAEAPAPAPAAEAAPAPRKDRATKSATAAPAPLFDPEKFLAPPRKTPPRRMTADRDPRFEHLPRQPAVPIENSIMKDGIICLFDGEKRTMLKRYLRVKYNMSDREYREFWGLSSRYPLVAPSYREKKSSLAVEQGLGQV